MYKNSLHSLRGTLQESEIGVPCDRVEKFLVITTITCVAGFVIASVIDAVIQSAPETI